MNENYPEEKDMPQDPSIFDEAESDDSSTPNTYNISSYGADFDVDGLVKRLRNGHIFIPPFQRAYVWSIKEASRLIESLLLGLPVPGIFLAKEGESNKLLVIDGQQRLKTLQYFYDEKFNPKQEDQNVRIFKLTNVQPQFEGKTYSELEENDKIRLNDTIIHATIIKQESPEDDDTSVYHVFERLNTGGRKLNPQEIRVAIYHGPFIELLESLNNHPSWKKIFGRTSNRLKDEELILRFFALYYESERYQRPMSEFLSKFTRRHRDPSVEQANDFETIFKTTVDAIASVGQHVFRPERAFNAAVFDAVMVGLANRLCTKKPYASEDLKTAYDTLLALPAFRTASSSATSFETNVSDRLKLANEAFASI
jgi:hypothetical protein